MCVFLKSLPFFLHTVLGKNGNIFCRYPLQLTKEEEQLTKKYENRVGFRSFIDWYACCLKQLE